MMWDVTRIKIFIAAAVFLITAGVLPAFAQQADVSLEVEINESLTISQKVQVQSLLTRNESGHQLFRLFIANNSSQTVTDLYLAADLRSEKHGLIFFWNQTNSQSFSLAPNQRVVATNNMFSQGLPGVEQQIFFSGNFTSEGQRFFNSLQGSANLPPDRYTLDFYVYQNNNRLNGGTLIASASGELGANIVEDIRDFYLIYPGDAVGSETVISNSYPNFIWQGGAGLTYRLVVVEEREGETPESLLGSARSSQPIELSGATNTGSFLEFEMIDILVNQSSFQYPNSGVQELKPGKTYYWQIISQLTTSSGLETRESEIWSFTLSGQQQGGTTAQLNNELERALQRLLGDRYEQLKESGVSFQSIEIDGETFEGSEALQKILQLSNNRDQGNVSIIIED